MKWSEDDTLRFVELYRESECLWNVNNGKYKNKQLRQIAIQNIMQQMGRDGFGEAEIKQKIKNLRSTFNQEVVKIKKSMQSGCAADDVYKPNVKWFSVMETVMLGSKGLYDVHGNLNSWRNSDVDLSDSVDIPENDASSPGTSHSIKVEMLPVDESKDPLGQFIQNADHSNPPPLVLIQQNTQRQMETNENGKLRGTKRRLQELSTAISELRKANAILSQPEPCIQENVAFGTYVASVLNKLHPQQAILAQNEIQNILTRYRLDSSSASFTNNSSPYHRPFTPPPVQSPSSASSSSCH